MEKYNKYHIIRAVNYCEMKREELLKEAKEKEKKQAEWQLERISLMEIELNHTKTLLESCEKALGDRDKKAERMYSEEDIALAFNEGQAYSVTGKLVDGKEWAKTHKKEWFEQFKKK